MLKFPIDGVYAHNDTDFPGISGTLKEIKVETHPKKPIQAFSCRYNWSPNGKTWRKRVYVVKTDTMGRQYWRCIGEVQKVGNWRGSWKVSISCENSWMQVWFTTEAIAEEFLMDNWKYHDPN